MLQAISSPGQGASQAVLSPSHLRAVWPALQIALLRVLYYLGFLLLPAALLWAGLSNDNVLGAVYLIGLVAWLLAHSLALEPHTHMGALGNAQVSCTVKIIRKWSQLAVLTLSKSIQLVFQRARSVPCKTDLNSTCVVRSLMRMRCGHMLYSTGKLHRQMRCYSNFSL